MIRAIVALDSKLGIANDKTIPWLGKIPSDTAYYRSKIEGSTIIMGRKVYEQLSAPYPNSINYVATHKNNIHLRDGFSPLVNVYGFMLNAKEDVWNIGGEILYKSTWDLIEELYITQLEGDFGCTKFIPEFSKDFELVSEQLPITENGITFRFQIWKRKK